MVDQQVNSFVQKFRDLWCGGFSAHLDLDCRGGEAWLGLRLHLGRHRAGGDQQGRDGGHRRDASYTRRMERRAAMRAAEQAARNTVSETPAHAEQAVEVSQVVPVHAMGAGDRDVRVVEVDVPTEEVVDTRKDDSEEVGDDLRAEEVVAVPSEPVAETGPASFATSSDDGDDRCRDCGFQVQGMEDHEHCVGNDWVCARCGVELHTISEEMAHLKCVRR